MKIATMRTMMRVIRRKMLRVMYVISMILGLSAVMVVGQGAYTGILLIAAAMIFIVFGGKMFLEHKIMENKLAKAKNDDVIADEQSDSQEEDNAND